ncbi:hypothetical protein QAD16_20020 [Stenotrophomonas geniculata]|nr:hypothetical protein [Stenotrophomonas geniculata]MDH7551631.1 hypothetical protein [Stenotrophomonas geniculata]
MLGLRAQRVPLVGGQQQPSVGSALQVGQRLPAGFQPGRDLVLTDGDGLNWYPSQVRKLCTQHIGIHRQCRSHLQPITLMPHLYR